MSENALGKASSDSTGGGIDSSVECPECGRDDFSSTQYMRIHHNRVHGGELRGHPAECHTCGTEFRARKYRIERSDRLYCSHECQHKGMTGLAGADHPNSTRVECECANCGKTLFRRKARLEKYNAQFCNNGCLGEYREDAYSGENSHRWKGGYERYYGANWERQRRGARERDDYTCQVCGVTESELGKELSVHHIFPVRGFDDPEDANGLINLVSMCEPCHSDWEGLYLRPDPRGNQ